MNKPSKKPAEACAKLSMLKKYHAQSYAFEM
jgi:hypothetical protein